jgi:hypothetical protein
MAFYNVDKATALSQKTPKQKRKIKIVNKILPIESIIDGGYIFRTIPRMGSIATNPADQNANLKLSPPQWQDDMGVDDYRRKCGRDRGRAISYLHFAD